MNRIDVVHNRQAHEDFHHDADSHHRFTTPAARVSVGLSCEELAERAGLSWHSIRERSSDSIPAATYSHLCCAVDVCLSASAERSTHYAATTITKLSKRYPPSSTPSCYGPGCSGPSRRRMPCEHEQEPPGRPVTGLSLVEWGAQPW